MATRSPPSMKTFRLDLTPGIWADLQTLADTGRFGATVPNVIEQFVREAVRNLILDGWLPFPPGTPPRAKK